MIVKSKSGVLSELDKENKIKLVNICRPILIDSNLIDQNLCYEDKKQVADTYTIIVDWDNVSINGKVAGRKDVELTHKCISYINSKPEIIKQMFAHEIAHLERKELKSWLIPLSGKSRCKSILRE